MESPPNRAVGQSPIEFLRARKSYFERKKNEMDLERLTIETELANKKNKRRGKKKKNSEKIIAEPVVEDETTWIVEEYNDIFKSLEAYKEHYMAISEAEMDSLVQLVFLGSLFDESSSDVLIQVNKWRQKAQGGFGNQVKQERVYLRKFREHLDVHERDERTHGKKLEEAINNMSLVIEKDYEQVKQIVNQVVRERNKTAGYDIYLRAKMRETEWYGGTLTKWLEKFGDKSVVTQLTLKLGDEITALRLTDIARYILRGIVKGIMHFHRKNVACGEFRSNDIIIASNYDVTFVNTPDSGSNNSKEEDMRSLSEIIKEIVKTIDNTPLDVLDLCVLLQNYSGGAADHIYHHSCLWTPMETVQNLMLSRLLIGASPDGWKIRDNVARVPEESSDWTMQILQHPLYERAFRAWVNKLVNQSHQPRGTFNQLSGVNYIERCCIGHAGLLSFFRMCFNHIHVHRVTNQATDTSRTMKTNYTGSQKGNREILKTEQELFVAFPTYSAHFLYENRDEISIMGIIRTDY